MKYTKTLLLSFLSILLLMGGGWELMAGEPVGLKPRPRPQRSLRTAADCLPPSASAQLDINNIRTLLHNGGDMWWDLVGSPSYEVPKGSGKNSLFAASLWIGGIDRASSQMRVAAQTYRQSGYDFWPGPLTGGSAEIDKETCEFYDKMFKINKSEIDEFRAAYSLFQAGTGAKPTETDYPNVFAWPTGTQGVYLNSDGDQVSAERTDGSIFYLAPWSEIGGDELTYEPEQGDYPEIKGDQAIWWVVNDKGDVHTETGGQPIGLEIHMMAFAFTTANAVNNMTFYDQTVINRSNIELIETYLGQWVDADLGFFRDDYVGCDTVLGLGICYNGDNNDEGASGYGLNPPAVGIDFFQGPLADANDGIDNDKDGEIDEEGETIIMSKFVYYNNDFSLTGNPEVATHYYNYLKGIWKDGTPIVDNYSNGGNGNGYGPSSPGPATNYMFSGDPCLGTDWTENNASNPPADRRFIQSAGPFTLLEGAVNRVIIGAVWARGFYQDQIGSVCELIRADKIAQALFDSNFQLLDGPDAPEVAVSELNREIILSWGYSEASKDIRNNYNEGYEQSDPVLKAEGVKDSLFRFQGYLVYQLLDQTVSANELDDIDRARVVLQCDVKDGVSSIVNRNEQAAAGRNEPLIIDQLMVNGSDEGILNSVQIKEDLFAQGEDKLLKNYSNYYYTVIAYAYNDTSSDGRQFVQGNRFFQVQRVKPHPVELEAVGTVTSAEYGDGIAVTMVAGVGNGGVFVELDSLTEAKIIKDYSTDEIGYKPNLGPIQVKIVDPKEVKGSYYQVKVTSRKFVSAEILPDDACGPIIDSTFAEWELYEGSNANGPYDQLVYQATYTDRISCSDPPPSPLPFVGTERVITGHGFSIAVLDVPASGDTTIANTGIVGARLDFVDPTASWLRGIPDQDDFFGGVWDWLEGGDDGRQFRRESIYDRDGDFQAISTTTGWGPFCLAKGFKNGQFTGGDIALGIGIGANTTNNQLGVEEFTSLAELPDVDVVLTSDITKWSKCMVVETSPYSGLGTGAWMLSGKWADNIEDPNQIGVENPAVVTRTVARHGFSWFPGYAIDVNTGTRLNIFFGESNWDIENNGNDMIFNPTSQLGNRLDKVGGRHYIYVTDVEYDEFASLKDTLLNSDTEPASGFTFAIGGFPNGHNMADIYKHVTWVGLPLLNPAFDEVTDPTLIPTDARVQLRVNQPFATREGMDDIPTFNFNTTALAVKKGVQEVAKTALDEIRAVPNPYYGYSAYETGQLSNVVKITNLPQRCKISIFSVNGHLVRTFNKDSNAPDQNWNLKNTAGVPVASGTYVVHIDAGELGQKVIKIFAVIRGIDLNSF